MNHYPTRRAVTKIEQNNPRRGRERHFHASHIFFFEYFILDISITIFMDNILLIK